MATVALAVPRSARLAVAAAVLAGVAVAVAVLVGVDALPAAAQDGPDIIPDPDPEGGGRPTNWGGLVVVGILLAVWVGVGAFLLVRARRRREVGRQD